MEEADGITFSLFMQHSSNWNITTDHHVLLKWTVLWGNHSYLPTDKSYCSLLEHKELSLYRLT